MSTVRSIDGVCDVTDHGPADRAVDVLIEVPHGATTTADFDRLRASLRGAYPEDLVAFFHVNTDIGAPECAEVVARRLTRDRSTGAPLRVRVVRSRIPRTFVDCNRVLEGADDGSTPALPEYVDDARDRAHLRTLHATYVEVADRAYADVAGYGVAVALHTYAPRSIRIERFDGSIVEALRRAYHPDTYASWPERPEVDLITEGTDGTELAPRTLVDPLAVAFERHAFEVHRNATYRLAPSTQGYRQAVRNPGKVVSLEINRALLADPFVPFVELTVPEERATRAALPIAEALAAGVRRHDRTLGDDPSDIL